MRELTKEECNLIAGALAIYADEIISALEIQGFRDDPIAIISKKIANQTRQLATEFKNA